jgi:hypothetical protein
MILLVMTLRVMTSLGVKRTLNPLISVRRLLDHTPASEGFLLGVLMIRGSPAAAEDAEEPEDTSADGEESAEPRSDVYVVA